MIMADHQPRTEDKNSFKGVVKMAKLSERQRLILRFIRDFSGEKGYPPTVRDIQRGCNVSSTSVVDYNLNILEREGYLRRDPEVSRGIEMLGAAKKKDGTVSVPLVGVIAAGEPIPVPTADIWRGTENVEAVDVSEELVGKNPDVYALRVRGLSMIDALIDDGDIVLMQALNSAQNGDMVAVWLKKEKEVTLKRFYQEGRKVRLQPANSQMSPIITQAANVQIQGKVVGVVRRLS